MSTDDAWKLWRRLEDQHVIQSMAGLISTLPFQPSAEHPEECIPIAEQLFDMIDKYLLTGRLPAEPQEPTP